MSKYHLPKVQVILIISLKKRVKIESQQGDDS